MCRESGFMNTLLASFAASSGEAKSDPVAARWAIPLSRSYRAHPLRSRVNMSPQIPRTRSGAISVPSIGLETPHGNVSLQGDLLRFGRKGTSRSSAISLCLRLPRTHLQKNSESTSEIASALGIRFGANQSIGVWS